MHALALAWVSNWNQTLELARNPPNGALLQQPGCPHSPRICCERRTWPSAPGRRRRSITESRWLPSLTLESVPLMTAAESNRYHMCARQRGRSRALASSITLSKRVSSSSRTSPAELWSPPLRSPTASACTDPAAALSDASWWKKVEATRNLEAFPVRTLEGARRRRPDVGPSGLLTGSCSRSRSVFTPAELGTFH